MDHSRAAFYRVVDDLVDQPYGCVEQTASRLIPLSLAYQSLLEDDPRKTLMMRQLYTHRLRLASMAGPEAHFGWWGQDMAVAVSYTHLDVYKRQVQRSVSGCRVSKAAF